MFESAHLLAAELVETKSTIGTLAVAAFMVIAVVATGFFFFLTGKETKISVRSAVLRMLSMLWALPVVAVVAYLGLHAVPRFTRDPEPPVENVRLIPEELTPDLGEALDLPEDALPTRIEDGSKDVPVAESPATDTPLPSWVGQRRVTDGETTWLVVRSAEKATKVRAETDAHNQAVEQLKQDFHRSHPNEGAWTIPLVFVQSDVISQKFVEAISHEPIRISRGVIRTEPMYRVHLQLELTPDVKEQLYQHWRVPLVNQRLWILGSLLGMLTLITGSTAAYLRLDARTGGAYRGRLKTAAVALIVSGGLVVSTII